MANVRDYLKRKKERKEQQGRINYREKIKSHKFMIFYRTILVAILIMAVGGALYVQWKNKVYTENTVVFPLKYILRRIPLWFPSLVIF